MLYLDTFGATGGVGRCSIELLPFLARRLGKVVVAGRSDVVDSYRTSLPADPKIDFFNLERPLFHPATWKLRALGRREPFPPAFTDALLKRAGVRSHNRSPVLVNYPQDLPPPRGDYEFDVLIHDLNWRRFPDHSPEAETLDARCLEWARQAQRIFTNSHFTRQEVIEHYQIEPARVIAAPLAPPSLPAPQGPSNDAARLAAFGLKSNEYFFYPATLGIHKGYEVLADALLASPASMLPVVITAPIPSEDQGFATPAQRYWPPVLRKLDTLRKSQKIISLPSLSWTDVLLIAGSCRAYVLPSRFEGFGFPLVEAMALGKFSICSEIPAFREILSRYGPLIHAATFPVGDAGALRDLLLAQSTSEKIPSSGRPDLSSSWNWADTAEVMAKVLEKPLI